MIIGVLALQGDFVDHIKALNKCKVEAKEVRLPEDIEDISGLIIPGGESTTIGKLMVEYKLDKAIKERYNKGMAIFGTCAGTIVMAKDIIGSNQARLGLLDISIARNDYGRQIDSFEAEIRVKDIGKINGVFIRAPVIKKIEKQVEILARYSHNPVLVRQDKILAATFHPEMTESNKVHEYFVNMAK